ncbi:hypothetical protein K1T73_16405 [Roseovarius sp. SCSIO 43702]|uniref:hypothetical protein n=1 Tax=Roseovarius sp. SCSIO 43702 TaxID=2823043 RepID=UPI001C739C6E|nr:hypothetical protein [Roseovarius sp. SCSIO 43702]QYX56599.1 hypothetical protein K1T73_16405 [Roseovarius sp. SCSIO 43702]
MIGLFIFIFGVPLAVFVILLMLRDWRTYLIGLGVVALLCGIGALMIYPLSPPGGPDDWFHGIEQVPLWGAALAALATLPAQGWRAWRRKRGQPTHYAAAIALTVGVILFVIFGPSVFLLR